MVMSFILQTVNHDETLYEKRMNRLSKITFKHLLYHLTQVKMIIFHYFSVRPLESWYSTDKTTSRKAARKSCKAARLRIRLWGSVILCWRWSSQTYQATMWNSDRMSVHTLPQCSLYSNLHSILFFQQLNSKVYNYVPPLPFVTTL